MNTASMDARIGIGLDAGGAARWVLVDGSGRERARGEVAGFSASQLATVQRPGLDAALVELAAALQSPTAARSRCRRSERLLRQP